MYLEHYGLREPPFSITPDPRFVFLSERHRDALAHLIYGIGQGGGSGFVQLTGEVGTGKTTLSRLLLEQLPETTRVALILNPLLDPVQLLETIGEELRLDLQGRRGDIKALIDALNVFLLDAYAAGERVVLIIDEAQNLSAAALEQVRLLTNLETPTQKLLQIVLLGQPELREQLARPELRQLAQRITARYHLDPLNVAESEAYVRHRWAVAGGGRLPFASAALRRLHQRAGGVPRLLNVIADRALLAGYARGEQPIGERLLDVAADEVLAPRLRGRAWIGWFAAALLLALVAAIAFRSRTPQRPAAPIATRVSTHPPANAAHASPQPPSIQAPLLDATAFAQRLQSGDADPRSAWSGLLDAWSVRANETDADHARQCPLVVATGLYCASGSAHLARIAQFDRPVVLILRGRTRSADALLLGLGPAQALLRIGKDEARVNRSVLEQALAGYAAIWRASPDIALPLLRGAHGPGVAWLRQHLLHETSTTSDHDAVFDDALDAAVRVAQQNAGLPVDGVVGPETWLALIATGRDGPHLRKLAE